MRNAVPILVRAGLFLLLLLFSGVMALTTLQNTRALHTLAQAALENTAFALSHAAEDALRTARDSDEVRQILSDRVVAYALIADSDGTILFHTNRDLVGQRLTTTQMGPRTPNDKPRGRRIVLGTGLPAYEYDYPLDTPAHSQMLRLVLQTTSADTITSRAERLWWALGAILTLLWTLGILFERITMRYIRLNAGMERQRRLGLIGQMTAVLAHEIRNALGSVKGSVQLVDEKVPAADPVKPALALAIQGTQRIETLVSDLLQFSREETYHLEDLDLAELIRESLRHALSGWEGQALVEDLPPIRVLADREKLLRVLVNGLNNARESMHGTGTIQIAMARQGRWIVVRIADTGTGIRPEDLPRLFEPFFTTKTTGTGLGLAYAKKVVEGMHGEISLANRPDGPGALLQIRLPRVRKEQHG